MIMVGRVIVTYRDGYDCFILSNIVHYVKFVCFCALDLIW